MSNKRFSVPSFAVVAIVCLATVHVGQGLELTSVEVMTSDCPDCGMSTIFGQLSVKVCGKNSPDALGGLCCAAIDMRNSDNNYQAGEIDTFNTPGALDECYRFQLGSLPGANNDIDMTIYHSGSDGGQFDYVQIYTDINSVYRCYFGQFMDGSSYLPAASCTKIQ